MFQCLVPAGRTVLGDCVTFGTFGPTGRSDSLWVGSVGKLWGSCSLACYLCPLIHLERNEPSHNLTVPWRVPSAIDFCHVIPAKMDCIPCSISLNKHLSLQVASCQICFPINEKSNTIKNLQTSLFHQQWYTSSLFPILLLTFYIFLLFNNRYTNKYLKK